jgi:hypothetical protein
MSEQGKGKKEIRLLQLHQRHMGLYHRVAEQIGVDASFVSRVASGTRNNKAITQALVRELRKLSRRAA